MRAANSVSLFLKALIVTGALTLALPASAFACGPKSHCKLADNRHYRIKLPDGYDGKRPIGAIFFAHSLEATAVGTLRNQKLLEVASRLGVALVGLKAASGDWNVKNSPAGRSDRSSNEYGYLDNVIADITRRFNIDKTRLVLAGSSVGGTFTWTMACTFDNRFAGFVPISGTYWLRPPKTCRSSPANVIHVHGTKDRTVPLTGRKVGSSRHSNVYELHKAYASIGKFKRIGKTSALDLKCTRSSNPAGKLLEFCLHDGGHAYNPEHIHYAWKRLEALGAL